MQKTKSNNEFENKIGLVRNNRIKPIKNIPHHIDRLYTFKDQVRCCFCGGKKCKHENFRNHKNPYLIGLNSDLVTESLVASQRPSTILLEKYEIIKQFKEKNIGLIVNLQREGEHPYCGPNGHLEENGYSYNPQDFISEGIDVILGGWKDMDVPDSMLHMLNLVKDMYEMIQIKQKKVLIHCHAGYGRTGILLACYMIFTSSKTVKQIVNEIRSVRKKCIEKTAQYEYCETFDKYVNRGRLVFTKTKRSLEYHLFNQTLFILPHSIQIRLEEEYKHIPRLVIDIIDKLSLLIVSGKTDFKKEKIKNDILSINYSNSLNINSKSNQIISNNELIEVNVSHSTITDAILGLSSWTKEDNNLLEYFKTSINNGVWYVIKNFNNVDVLIELLWDWLDDSVITVIPPSKILSLFSDNLFEQEIDKYNEILEEGLRKSKIEFLLEVIRNKFNYNEYYIICFVAIFINKAFINSKDSDFSSVEKILYKFCVLFLGYGLHYYYEYYYNKEFKVTENSQGKYSFSGNYAHDNIILNSQSGNQSRIINNYDKKHLYSRVYSAYLMVKLLKFIIGVIKEKIDLGVNFN